ncbi:hypothetical protein [Streptomyces zingiberis]|uniref:Uncharacterized protein n=1 Tax=Streptomyces zingiberis TaxID=2053010 RepID=A0ABX1BW24_9ACTN|nr:hypothetical protein [Streptomyces zingiberis]NJQ01866.1 hypothetical protein [Streptomyces zingiberis]
MALRVTVERDAIVDATQFSVAFFATILTGEAVIFAISFNAASGWPSLREIDTHIAFREWVVIGWLASVFTVVGLLGGSDTTAFYGALLFLLADVFGIFSFVRLFGLASAGGRKRLLLRTLRRSLERLPTEPERVQERLRDDPVVSAYLAAVDQAVGRRDTGAARDLVDELTGAAQGHAPLGGAAALHVDVIHRLARTSLMGGMDAVVAAEGIESLVDSLLTIVARTTPAEPTTEAELIAVEDAAVALGRTSRYLAWLAGTALTLSVRRVADAGSARELVAVTTRCRDRILREVDPDPQSAAPEELRTPLTTPTAVLAWVGGFTQYHGSHQAAAFYPTHELLAGRKFMGNYWDGASVLTALRQALYGRDAGGRATGPAAEASRRAFGSVAEFDRFWTLASVGAIATLRHTGLPHPPALIRPEFTPDPQLLGAYLRTFGSHRWFSDAEQARSLLASVMSRKPATDGAWGRVRAAGLRSAVRTPVPEVEPHHRPAAMVLAVAARLAPLSDGEPDRQLRLFLDGLPQPVIEATARLAARALPGGESGDGTPADPRGAVITGLQVMRLVGNRSGSLG